MHKKALVLLVCLTSIGCTSNSTEEIYSSTASNIGRGVLALGTVGMSEFAMKNKEADEEYIESKCTDLGLKKGTEAYANCWIRIYEIQNTKRPNNTD